MPTYLELANFFDVPVAALRVARPSELTCKTEGCMNHAIVGNYRFCAYHNQKWYPIGKVTGHLLLGEDYLFTKNNKKLKYKCQCNSTLCGGIGYCDAGRFPFPNNEKHRQLWFDAMSWDIDSKNYELDVNSKPSNHCIAYWHFDSKRRAKLSGGQWTLIGRTSPYHNEITDKHYEILVPSNTIENFIEEAKGGSSSSPRKPSYIHEQVPYYLLAKPRVRPQVKEPNTEDIIETINTSNKRPFQNDNSTIDDSTSAQISKRAREESELLLNLRYATSTLT